MWVDLPKTDPHKTPVNLQNSHIEKQAKENNTSKLWNYYSENERICFVFSAISAPIWKTYSMSWL